MPSETMMLGVVLERRATDNPWEDHVWQAVAVLPGAPEDPAGGPIAEGDGWTQYHAGTLPLEINHRETEDYRYNLANDPPSIYVILREDEEDAERDVAPFMLSASPFEAQTYQDAEENIVEPVPMPASVVAWIGEFVERYHVEQPVYKRKRKPHDPRKGGDGLIRPVAPVSRGESGE